MPIHDVGYRQWVGRKISHYYSWLIMVWMGISITRKNFWVKRLILAAWLPSIYLGFGIFAFENMISQRTQENFQLFQSAFMRPYVQGNPQNRAISPFGESEQVLLDLLSGKTDDVAGARHAGWCWLMATFLQYPQAVSSLILVGLIAPPLIARDVRSKAFLLYFSKPIGKTEYLIGKSLVLASFLAFITLVPCICTFMIGLSLAPDFSVLLYTWDIPFRILFASLVFIVPTTVIALLFSSLTQETRFASYAWFCYWGLGFVAWNVIRLGNSVPIVEELNQAAFHASFDSAEKFAETTKLPPEAWIPRSEEEIDLLQQRLNDTMYDSPWEVVSLYDSLCHIQRWIMGIGSTDTPWLPILFMTGLTSVCLFVLVRRVSAPVSI